MCRGYVQLYRYCPHETNFTITAPCEAGALNGACNNVIVRQTIVQHPLYCPACYRSKEEYICETYDHKIFDYQEMLEMIESEIYDKEADRRNRYPKDKEQERLEARREKLKSQIHLQQQKRQQALRAFRNQNCVWGDG